MINITKLANGNILISDSGTSATIKILSPNITEIECDDLGKVKVIQQNANVEYFIPSEINNINGVAFSGDCVDLINELGTNFFFIVDTGNWVFVNDIYDLPLPVAGVITLEADKTYVIAPESGTLDLNGNRIVCSGIVTLLGGSSETSYITSTGLGAGIPLITTEWTLAMQFLSIANVDTAIAINGAINPPCALDWTGVNFLNVPNIGLIDTCDNFVYTKGAFLNSKNLIFDGSHGTIAFNNSLLRGDGAAGDIVKVNSTATISRRFRIIYSSVIASGSTNGINLDVAVTIPNEAFILDVVNFSGGGTYLAGVTSTDNKALFTNCTGIANSGDISQYYMNGNATPTLVALIGTPYKALGTTTSAAVTQKFTNTDNRATYIGALTRYFSVTASLSCTSGNNHQIGIYIAKNGSILPESEVYITTNGAGRAEGAVVQSLVQLTNGDYIEIFVENSTAATDITVTDLNTIII